MGSISLNSGLFFVSNYSEAQVGVQNIDGLPGKVRHKGGSCLRSVYPGKGVATGGRLLEQSILNKAVDPK